MNEKSPFLGHNLSLIRPWVLVILVAILCWSGLGYLVFQAAPTFPWLFLFFPLLFLALSATASLLAGYLNARLADPRSYRVGVARPLRQGALLGLFVVVCAGLQMARLLNWMVAVFLFVVLLSVEILVLHRSF